METKKTKVVYENLNGRFKIYSQPNIRNYGNQINSVDRVFTIEAADKYAYTTEDIGAMIYHLLVNKVLPKARRIEFEKLVPHIIKAFTESNQSVPISSIPVCEYINCLKCLLYKDGHCQSDGAKIINTFTKASPLPLNNPQPRIE